MTARYLLTLTVNPAVDVVSDTKKVEPTRKNRTQNEQLRAGGGGINAARMLKTLDTDPKAMFLSGGVFGQILHTLVQDLGLEASIYPIQGQTRLCQTIIDQSTGLEYRFVPEGPTLDAQDTQKLLAAIEDELKTASPLVIASGSLPQGMPERFYQQLNTLCAQYQKGLVLDTSGAALQHGLSAQTPLALLKPSLRELEKLVGKSLPTIDLQVQEAKNLVQWNLAKRVAVSLGEEGALLISQDGQWMCPGLRLEVQSAVGAGDAFTAGLTKGLLQGLEGAELLSLGMATGSAVVGSSTYPSRQMIDAYQTQAQTMTRAL